MSELTTKVVAGTPLKVTAVALRKWFPVIVTRWPASPDPGLKPLIEGP